MMHSHFKFAQWLTPTIAVFLALVGAITPKAQVPAKGHFAAGLAKINMQTVSHLVLNRVVPCFPERSAMSLMRARWQMRRNPRLTPYLTCFLLLIGAPPLSLTIEQDMPLVTALEPNAAVTTPGTKVVVYGSGFSPDAVVYFGGLEARETKLITASQLEVMTPYFRPGSKQIQLKSGGNILRSEVTFTSLPSPTDSEIDRAVSLAEKGQTSAAITILTAIAKTNADYQVRAFAYYQMGQIYFAVGDWWRWAGVPIYLDSEKSGAAIQTYWRYRLSTDQSTYLLHIQNDPDHDLKLADWTVEKDVTQNPEPRFYRALVSARYGKLAKAEADSDFILSLEPGNPSYRALAAYISVLAGKKPTLPSFSSETTTDARALSLLGEAAYLSGDAASAQHFWVMAAKAHPLGASLACLAGKKHVRREHKSIAAALLSECIAMAPASKEAKEAQELIATLQQSSPH